MNSKNLVLASALLALSSSALAGGYVISFEAGMKDGFQDEVGPILNLQNDVYEECYDAGKPLVMHGKIYLDMDQAPPVSVKSNGYQADYNSTTSGWIKYELIIPDHNILSHNPDSEDYCVDNNLNARSKLFIGEIGTETSTISVKGEFGKLLIVNDRETSYNDTQDRLQFWAYRQTNISESSDAGYRNRVHVKANLEKWLDGSISDMISTFYIDSLQEVSGLEANFEDRHARDEYPFSFNYTRYIDGDIPRVNFNAEILKVNSVDYVSDFDLTHITCEKDISHLYNSDNYYCM